MTIIIVVGTRPETIKMAPIIRGLEKQDHQFTFVHTGQHFDYNMSLQFIKELKLPNPDYSFKLINSRPASQIGEIMTKLDRTIDFQKTRLLLIQGDTNTMLATALTGIKLCLKIGHVEAGLRSYDWRMPEEHNRRMVDHISDMLFAPTKTARQNLLKENVHGKIYITGNSVIDAVVDHLPLAEKQSKIMQSIEFKKYILATLHRVENVDDPKTLKELISAFLDSPMPILFPVHPRTMKRLRQLHIIDKIKNSRNIQVTPPFGYFDFLVLMKNCQFILTDSGGIQEEATAPNIRKVTLILRPSTERPEAVSAGFARIVGVKKKNILEAITKYLDNPPTLPLSSPFGDGKTSEKILDAIKTFSGL